MIRHSLVYHHNNGEFEGFTGIGFTSQAAEEDAKREIKKKLIWIGEITGEQPIFDPDRIINDTITLIKMGGDMKQIQNDWEICKKRKG